MKRLTSTTQLLEQAQGGDEQALSDFLVRLRSRLHTWGRGRLPGWARGLVDTEDLVQDVLRRTLSHIGQIKPEGFHAYVRTAILNALKNEVDRAGRRRTVPLEWGQEFAGSDGRKSAVLREDLASYDAALQQMNPKCQACVILRLEWGLPFAEIRDLLEFNSADAARIQTARCVDKMAQLMETLQ